MFEYRRATISDIEELLKARIDFLIELNGIRDLKDKQLMLKQNHEYIINSMSNGSFIEWVALKNKKIIATSSISIYTLPPHMARINGKVAYVGNINTYPEYRKLGIATKLLSFLIEEAKKAEISQMILNATDMGKQIYEKLGFKLQKDEMILYL